MQPLQIICSIPIQRFDGTPYWVQSINEFIIWDSGIPHLVPMVCKHQNTPLRPPTDGTYVARCPLHGWQLDICSRTYINPRGLEQLTSNYTLIQSPSFIHILEPEPNQYLVPTTSRESDIVTFIDKHVEYINHACFIFTTDTVSFVSDPWLLGPAFTTGWFLSTPTSIKQFTKVLHSQYCYISHSHPDHLNPLTLLVLKSQGWNPTFIIPEFPQTDQTYSLLRQIGFANIVQLSNKESFTLDDGHTVLQMLLDQSGRNDSSMLISYKGYTILNNVDALSPDADHVSSVDLAFLPFANGASSYPVCWQNYTLSQVSSIQEKQNRATISHFFSTASKLKCKAIFPFAGYFSSFLPEDSAISSVNIKNTVQQLQESSHTLASIIHPPHFNKNLRSSPSRHIAIRDILANEYEDFTSAELIRFLQHQDFTDNLVLRIIAYDIDFKVSPWFLDWDFRTNTPLSNSFCDQPLDPEQLNESGLCFLSIQVRQYALGYTIRNSLPWEEFSIGFQARFFRSPNTYNYRFWNHFQNHIKPLEPVLDSLLQLWNSSQKLRNYAISDIS